MTDDGLANVEPLEKLTTLNLASTAVSDAGLEHLKGLTNLRQLNLAFTQTTDEGRAKLQEALPNVKIGI